MADENMCYGCPATVDTCALLYTFGLCRKYNPGLETFKITAKNKDKDIGGVSIFLLRDEILDYFALVVSNPDGTTLETFTPAFTLEFLNGFLTSLMDDNETIKIKMEVY